MTDLRVICIPRGAKKVIDKIVPTVTDALSGIEDGSTVLLGGFGTAAGLQGRPRQSGGRNRALRIWPKAVFIVDR
jgi:hypothetical protein